MSQFTPAMLLYWMGDQVLQFHRGIDTPVCSGGIKLLEEKGGGLRSDCLYIGEPPAVLRAAEQGRLPGGGAFIVAGNGGAFPEDYVPPANLTLMVTSLSLFTLYNTVQEHIHRFAAWDARLHQVVYTNGGLHDLLERAAEEIHATILLVNAGYKHIAAVYSPQVHDPTADELQKNEFQSFETIESIRRQQALCRGEQNEYVEYVSSDSNNYTIVRMIRYRGSLAARLCVIMDGPEPNPCYSDLTAVLAGYISEYMFSNQGADYGSNGGFAALAADLIECRITTRSDLEERLKNTKLAVRRYYHVMIIAFDSKKTRGNIPWNYIINQLEVIFPFSNITTYRGDILLIIRKQHRGSRLVFDEPRLTRVLEEYNGFAAVGNTSEHLTSLPPMYHQTKDALRIGRVLDPDKRIFFYEDYSVYQIIELAGESARQKLGSRNLVHLCNNEMVALMLYDKKHNTNMAEVLQTYLLLERNAAKTAKALYIHRNTMLYKIHKIEEIIGTSLDDPILRERLLFSYRVLEYMTRYLDEDLLVLKRAQPTENGGSTPPKAPAAR